MRLARLDLIRFGHFTDYSLDLPRGTPDLHLVFGPNEAGKTTAMTAVEDLLFGIPNRTPYRFRHDYRSLRLGAVIEARRTRLELCRRKGVKDTLLDPDGAPLPGGEPVLTRLLGGAGGDFRIFFERMFNLSHERLLRGGRAILASEGEIGQALVAAGAGLTELRSEARALRTEAESLWTPRRNRTRAFYRAQDHLRTEEGKLQKSVLVPQAWQVLERRRIDALTALTQAKERYEARSREARKCSRIRRVLPDIRRLAEIERARADLAVVEVLPADAMARFERAERQRQGAESLVVRLREELTARQEELGTISPDAALLAREAEVEELVGRRSEIAGMRQALPKRQGELDSRLATLRARSLDLAWSRLPDDHLLDRIPSPALVSRARVLLQKRAGLSEARAAADKSLVAARQRKEEQEERRIAERSPLDGERLASVLEVTGSAAELETRTREARKDLAGTADRLDVLMGGLRPSVADAVELVALPVPPKSTVTDLRDRMRDAEREVRVVERRLEQREVQVGRQRRERRRIRRDQRLDTEEDLRRVRADRDAIWERFKRLRCGLDSDGDELGFGLADEFETALGEADAMADRRLEHAEAAARLTDIARELSRLEEEREADLEEASRRRHRIARLDLQWRSLWEGCPFLPEAPDVMLLWLDRRERILDAAAQARRAHRELDDLVEADRTARGQVVEALAACGVDPNGIVSDRLPVLIRRAEKLHQEHANRLHRDREVRKAIRSAQNDLRRAEAEAEERGREWQEFELRWTEALDALELSPQTPAETVNDQIRIFEEMRETATEARQIRDTRINTMLREIGRFEKEVVAFVSKFAPNLAYRPSEDAVAELDLRLAEAKQQRRLGERVASDIARLEAEIRAAEREVREAELALAPLFGAAGVEDREALRAAIGRSDRLRTLTAQFEETTKNLGRAGDGLSLEELRAECAGAHPDAAAAAEEEARVAERHAADEMTEASGDLRAAEHDLKAVRGDDSVAQRGARREEARARLREVAERYARVGTAAILLKWALDRFGREKRVPMLERASQFFRLLTADRFRGLTMDFDQNDQMAVFAQRSAEETVEISGLSSGTEDQLFLALRIAYIEDYVSSAPALPFVADDLFLNFDNERAAGGFRALARLAERTQVLFFTHHEHLLAIARETLGPGLRVHRLHRPNS